MHYAMYRIYFLKKKVAYIFFKKHIVSILYGNLFHFEKDRRATGEPHMFFVCCTSIKCKWILKKKEKSLKYVLKQLNKETTYLKRRLKHTNFLLYNKQTNMIIQ